MLSTRGWWPPRHLGRPCLIRMHGLQRQPAANNWLLALFLMFGRMAHLPIELAYCTSETATQSPNEYAAAALQKSLGSAFEQVRKNFKHKLYRQKAFYDCKVNGQHYERDVLLSQKGSLTSCTTHGQAPIALRSTCTTKQYGWCSSMALNLGRILSVRGAV